MTGRRTKYNSETVEKILEGIKETGSDKIGWMVAGIGRDTFYQWKARYPDFSDRVAIAKEEFRRIVPETLIEQAKQSLRDYLFTGSVETWSSKEVHKDGAGNILKTIDRVSKAVKPTPGWVLERVLGKNLPVLEALQVLLSEGVATNYQARVIAEGISRIEQELKQAPGGEDGTGST